MYRQRNQETNNSLPALFDNPTGRSELDRSAAETHRLATGLETGLGVDGEAAPPPAGVFA